MDAKDEVTLPLYLSRDQIDALVIGIPEAIAGCKHRLDYFQSDKVLPKLLESGYDEDAAKEEIEDNIALCESLIPEYVSILKEIKELYPMLDKKTEETSGNKIILETSWPPKTH